MFETGMSALVLKICSEYAKALGLNFPPCVQQEINAIAQYVDLHTVKDLKVEQDGSVVTITCFTEGEQEKVFTVTLPEVNVDVLFNLIKGSSSVVVDKSEDGTHLVVRLDKSQEVQSIRLYNPQEPLTAEQLAILKANQENYILLYGSSIYKLQSAYVRDENTCVYSAADLSYGSTAGITNVVVNMSNGVWDTESTNLQNSIIYVELTPSTATQGVLTSSQLDILETDKSNCIILNNEIYRLADNQNVSGLITYVHTGWDGTARKDKSISITVSTKAWTLVVAESGGGKLYRHNIRFKDGNVSIGFDFIDSNKLPYTSTTLEMPVVKNVIFFTHATSSGMPDKQGFGYIYSVGNGYCGYVGVYIASNSGSALSAPEIETHYGASMSAEFTDTVTEV